MTEATKKRLLRFQQDEVNSSVIYEAMAKREKAAGNKRVLQKIADDERDHAQIWEQFTGVTLRPKRLKVFWYKLMGRMMGYTFVIRLLERDEYTATKAYGDIIAEVPEAREIMLDEERHEAELTNMLDEERLQYVGAMVLGLNDALVELTGTIAGMTFAMMHTRIVALSGIITGVSATLSMAASNYLAERASGNPNALKSSLYTGIAYLITVVFLVLPFLLFPTHMYVPALACMLAVVVLIILFFNYYIAVAQNTPFLPRFLEMAGISLGVAIISFGIGLLAKQLLGIDI